MVLSQQPVTREVLQGSILGPKMFKVFISVLDNRIGSTLTKFAHDSKLDGEVGTSEGRTILQDRLEDRTGKQELYEF